MTETLQPFKDFRIVGHANPLWNRGSLTTKLKIREIEIE